MEMFGAQNNNNIIGDISYGVSSPYQTRVSQSSLSVVPNAAAAQTSRSLRTAAAPTTAFPCLDSRADIIIL